MTNEQYLSLLHLYRSTVAPIHTAVKGPTHKPLPEWNSAEIHCHVLWMCDQAKGFRTEAQYPVMYTLEDIHTVEKRNRWLAWIQCALSFMGHCTIDDTRNDIRRLLS